MLAKRISPCAIPSGGGKRVIMEADVLVKRLLGIFLGLLLAGVPDILGQQSQVPDTIRIGE